jgi:deferrochelatase/peroxidase EfeB
MRIDLDDIQTNILRSVDPAFTLYLFFRISKAQAFRSFLASALEQNLTFAGMPTGLYAERHRLKRRSRSVEAATTETESPTRSHSLHMNVGFTWPGLMRLGVEKETCASFPEPFREGMAARATVLGDVGAAAPEYWDGYLGSRTVDGVILWNWWDIRKEHRLPGPVHDKLKQLALDTWGEIKGAASAHGIEILHSETGIANYRQFASGDIDRVEHFGFRDGISQPWIDFGMADANGLSHPAPGGGTPRQNGQWAPLAPGEFVLGYPDEDGLIQPWPCNRLLRCGGMYMVFRKLEQDVLGFRNFLRDAAPDPVASGLLAAQMFGRWPDGTPLVQSPHGPDDRTPRDPNRPLNDFRYERDDRDGRRCPIGAHIRRSNPRDTRGRNESRRHRLLRRGITYGGPILPHDSPGDGRRRGVLFVALNARIDQQFEFVQSRWLNSGELVGQVGAGRDPINATNEGQLSDSFWAHSRPGPVTNLTRFAQVFINVPRASELIDIAQRTTAELFGHLDDLIAKAHRSKKEGQSKANNKTLLGCMVDNVPDNLTFDEFNEHNKRIRLVLAERIVGGTDTLNKAIVNVIDFLLKCPDRLKQARNTAEEVEQALKLVARSPSAAAEQELAEAQSKLDALIWECLRFNPVAPMICRACEDDTEIEGWRIKKGALVCLLMKTAMFDQRVFRRPDDFVPDRVDNSYLTFGVAPHTCSGQKVAETVLRIVIKRLLLLKDLRRAAGPAGELKDVLGLPLPDSMVVRFSL